MAKAWTAAEDAIIRENAEMGPSWAGYKLLLPGRTYTAIMTRRRVLGVAFATPGRPRGTSATGAPRRRRTKEATCLPDIGTWTSEQREALVMGVEALTEQTGHTVRECVVEFARLVAELKNNKEKEKES